MLNATKHGAMQHEASAKILAIVPTRRLHSIFPWTCVIRFDPIPAVLISVRCIEPEKTGKLSLLRQATKYCPMEETIFRARHANS